MAAAFPRIAAGSSSSAARASSGAATSTSQPWLGCGVHSRSHNHRAPPPRARRGSSSGSSNSRRNHSEQLHQQQQRQQQRELLRDKRELLAVPGIGKKYRLLLASKGVTDLAALKTLLVAQHEGDAQRTAQYLRDHVGIRNRLHCDTIVKHVAELCAAADGAQVHECAAPSASGRPLTLCVEGNISAGKSTFLRHISDGNQELSSCLQVVQEPVDKWKDVGDKHINMLKLFYDDPKRYAYTFQNYVFVTRLMQERTSVNSPLPYRLLERSVFSDRMVFVRAVHEAQLLNDAELEVYDSWFDPLLEQMPSLVPDGFIYLKADPDTCFRRMQLRNRLEESDLEIDYLQGLHSKHEDWLGVASNWQNALAEGDAYDFFGDNRQIIEMAPQNLRSELHFLNRLRAPVMHAKLNRIPALILDCNNDVDMANDQSAKEHMSKKVLDYVQYVEKLRNMRRRLQDSVHSSNAAAYRVPGATQKPGIKLDIGMTEHYLRHLIREETSGRLGGVHAPMDALKRGALDVTDRARFQTTVDRLQKPLARFDWGFVDSQGRPIYVANVSNFNVILPSKTEAQKQPQDQNAESVKGACQFDKQPTTSYEGNGVFEKMEKHTASAV